HFLHCPQPNRTRLQVRLIDQRLREHAPPHTIMKTRTVAIVTLLIALGGGYYLYDVSARQVADPDIIQAAVTAGDVVETVQVTGTLQPIPTVNVGSQVSGIVSELLADFNSVVRKDQVIARIEPSLFQVQVDLQTAAVERQLGEISR